MKIIFLFLIPLFVLCDCGRKGPPLPPLTKEEVQQEQSAEQKIKEQKEKRLQKIKEREEKNAVQKNK